MRTLTGGPVAPSPVHRLLMRRYATAKLLARVRLWRRERGAPPPVLVHQMGKVASQAVTRSLQEAGLAVYQTHFLSAERLRRAEQVYRRSWDPNAAGRAGHLWQGQRVRRRLKRRPGERWQVITLARDPVARNVSSFFQVAQHQYGIDLRALTDGARGDLAPTLSHLFGEVFDEHDLPLRWFDDELEAVLGVDVYSQPFPHDRGFAIYSGARADVLVIRYEDLPQVFSAAVSQFLRLESIPLVRKNESRAKDYGQVYASAVRDLVLPDNYLERMYGSRYARHFFTAAERTQMMAQWRGRAAGMG